MRFASGSPMFGNRREAGAVLAHRLARYGAEDVLVLGLPRGGIPVAYEVAVALAAPLEAFVVRKLGVPHHEELAMGAIASGGARVLVQDVVDSLGIAPSVIEEVAASEQRELERRELAFRGSRPFPDLHGRTVIVVDDGVATGASMRVAIRAVRAQGAMTIVAAAPVMSRQAFDLLLDEADACEAIERPEPFHGVGMHYADFAQTTDEEVRALLAAAARRQVGPSDLDRQAVGTPGGSA